MSNLSLADVRNVVAQISITEILGSRDRDGIKVMH
jgi:hypothetical protein